VPAASSRRGSSRIGHRRRQLDTARRHRARVATSCYARFATLPVSLVRRVRVCCQGAGGGCFCRGGEWKWEGHCAARLFLLQEQRWHRLAPGRQQSGKTLQRCTSSVSRSEQMPRGGDDPGSFGDRSICPGSWLPAASSMAQLQVRVHAP
jgi:hypothetical protein